MINYLYWSNSCCWLQAQPLLEKSLLNADMWADQGALGCDRGSGCNSLGENRGCRTRLCVKRAASDEMGPFWANRGKREPNPSPMYKQEQLFADEPHWILVRRDEDGAQISDYDPFFVTRGKKSEAAKRFAGLLARRNNEAYYPSSKKNEEINE